jgi:hypothetical protein
VAKLLPSKATTHARYSVIAKGRTYSYSGKRNDFAGGDFWDPSNDGVSDNLYYHPTRFIRSRLSSP